jgi:alkylation response protein AidB-like acyl-CoA dehydrogenase
MTEEQLILRESLRGFFSRAYSSETRRQQLAEPLGAPGVWRALADDLGILGASFDESLGGLGGGTGDTLLIMEAIGRHLVLEPYLPTVILAGGVLRRSDTDVARELIRQVIAGDLRMALAYAEPQARYDWRNVATTARSTGDGWVLTGEKCVVLGGPQADKIVVTARTSGEARDRDGLSVFVIEASAAGLSRRDYRLIDGRPASELRLDRVSAPTEARLFAEPAAAEVIEAVLDEGAAAVCAETSALLHRMVMDTVAYTKTRMQFGVPISSFQALQHRMVDMLISAETAAAISTAAMASLTAEPAERSRAVSAAKAFVGNAARFVAQNAVQLHGGMGITDELSISHCFKRATVFETEFGSTDHHLARYEQTVLC